MKMATSLSCRMCLLRKARVTLLLFLFCTYFIFRSDIIIVGNPCVHEIVEGVRKMFLLEIVVL